MRIPHARLHISPYRYQAATTTPASELVGGNAPETRPRVLYNSRWEAIIGLEIHTQIKSATKLFSASSTSFNAPSNIHVSPIDAAYPGTLPHLSQECVDLAIKTSLALNATINKVSSFDRKHYFYPDLPQGYQITQHYAPLSKNGCIRLTPLDGLDYSLDVGIEQLQLEQDTGKSLHDVYPGMTLIDLNRAGTGLMEIVTKPDMRSSQEAAILLRKLQALLRAVGSSDGNMDETSQPYGARCELKNLNSIKFVSDAIDAEITRQIQSYEEGVPVVQETRGYDVSTGKTVRLRSKESAPDYRYMPEPDLPRLVLSQETIDRIKASLPELPDAQRDRIMNQYSLGLVECRTLMGEEGMVPFFEQVVAGRKVKSVISWTIHELLGRLHSRGRSFGANTVTAKQLGSLIDSVDDGTISAKIGKQVLNLMIAGDTRDATAIIDDKGWRQLDNTHDLEKMCDEIMAKYPDKVNAIRSGSVGVVGFLMGQLMAQTKGRANPVTLNAVLRAKLGLPSTADNSKKGGSKRKVTADAADGSGNDEKSQRGVKTK
ncbi:hypothetical protein BGW42_006439 [Actinomortierella wolfii]|nr:hypothetical protein BGW42_006439 [Actinomortierella wolfii]